MSQKGTAVTLNAGVIGLGSTMVGQLSAGASFDEAFQAGMKAGVVSAVAAGAAYGVNDYLGLNPTGVDATGKLTYSEAAMRYYRLSAVERLGTGTFWAQASSNAVTRGVLAQAQGGKFATGMVGGFTGTMLSSMAQIIGDVTREGFSLENVLLHTGLGCVGALAAGDKCAAGAIGGGVSAAVSPWVGKAFSESGPRTPVEKMITAVTSVTAGMGVAAALGYDHLPAGQAAQNEVMNNYLDHRRPQMLRLSEKERYENAVQGCANGNQAACRVRDELAALSRARDIRLRNACNGSNPALCNELAREATEMGNVVYGRQGGFVYANSPKSGPIRGLNTETIGPPSRPDNFHDELARSTLDAAIMEGGNIVAGATLGLAGNWFSKLQGWGTTKTLGTGVNIPKYVQGTLPSADEAAFAKTLSYIDSGTIPSGNLARKWGTTFKNLEGELPGAQGSTSPYLEYRVAPSAGQAGAGTNRIVVNSQTGEVYYTWTHYGDSGTPAFVKVR